MTHETCIGRSAVPAGSDALRLLVLGFKTSLQEFFRDPGAAHLVLFAKFVTTAGANNCHMVVRVRDMPGDRRKIPKARRIGRDRRTRSRQKIGSRGGKHYERTMTVAPLQE